MIYKNPKYLICRIALVMKAVNGKLKTMIPIPKEERKQDYMWKLR